MYGIFQESLESKGSLFGSFRPSSLFKRKFATFDEDISSAWFDIQASADFAEAKSGVNVLAIGSGSLNASARSASASDGNVDVKAVGHETSPEQISAVVQNQTCLTMPMSKLLTANTPLAGKPDSRSINIFASADFAVADMINIHASHNEYHLPQERTEIDESEFVHLVNGLQSFYKKQLITQIKPLFISSNTAVIQYAKLKLTEKREPHAKEIPVEDIFSRVKQNLQTIWIEGDGGHGKSTLCKYMVQQWVAQATWLSQFDAVVYIPLSNLNSQKYPPKVHNSDYSLKEVMFKEFFIGASISEAQMDSIFGRKKVLCLLDGYETIFQVPSYLGTVVQYLIARPQYRILTSRPCQQDHCPNAFKLYLAGLCDQSIQNYLDSFFGTLDLVEVEQKSIEKHSLSRFLCGQTRKKISDIAHIPIYLEIICHVWGKEELEISTSSVPTDFLKVFLDWIIKTEYVAEMQRRWRDYKEDASKIIHHAQGYYQEEFLFLSQLAFSLQISQPCISALFDESLIRWPLVQKFVHIDNTISKDMIFERYRFIHLIFQEFFAARYVVHVLNSTGSVHAAERAKVEQFLAMNKYEPQNRNVIIFVAGIDRTTFDVLLNQLQNGTRDLVGKYHEGLLISCFNEIKFDPSSALQEATIAHIGNIFEVQLENIVSELMRENIGKRTLPLGGVLCVLLCALDDLMRLVTIITLSATPARLLIENPYAIECILPILQRKLAHENPRRRGAWLLIFVALNHLFSLSVAERMQDILNSAQFTEPEIRNIKKLQEFLVSSSIALAEHGVKIKPPQINPDFDKLLSIIDPEGFRENRLIKINSSVDSKFDRLLAKLTHKKSIFSTTQISMLTTSFWMLDMQIKKNILTFVYEEGFNIAGPFFFLLSPVVFFRLMIPSIVPNSFVSFLVVIALLNYLFAVASAKDPKVIFFRTPIQFLFLGIASQLETLPDKIMDDFCTDWDQVEIEMSEIVVSDLVHSDIEKWIDQVLLCENNSARKKTLIGILQNYLKLPIGSHHQDAIFEKLRGYVCSDNNKVKENAIEIISLLEGVTISPRVVKSLTAQLVEEKNPYEIKLLALGALQTLKAASVDSQAIKDLLVFHQEFLFKKHILTKMVCELFFVVVYLIALWAESEGWLNYTTEDWRETLALLFALPQLCQLTSLFVAGLSYILISVFNYGYPWLISILWIYTASKMFNLILMPSGMWASHQGKHKDYAISHLAPRATLDKELFRFWKSETVNQHLRVSTQRSLLKMIGDIKISEGMESDIIDILKNTILATSSSPQSKLMAIEALGKIGAKTSSGKVVVDILQLLLSEPNMTSFKEVVLVAMEKTACYNAATIEILMSIAFDAGEPLKIRVLSLKALQQSGDEHGNEFNLGKLVNVLFSNDDKQIKKAICEIIGGLRSIAAKSPSCLAGLISAMRFEETRSMVVEAIGDVGAEARFPAVIEALLSCNCAKTAETLNKISAIKVNPAAIVRYWRETKNTELLNQDCIEAAEYCLQLGFDDHYDYSHFLANSAHAQHTIVVLSGSKLIINCGYKISEIGLNLKVVKFIKVLTKKARRNGFFTDFYEDIVTKVGDISLHVVQKEQRNSSLMMTTDVNTRMNDEILKQVQHFQHQYPGRRTVETRA